MDEIQEITKIIKQQMIGIDTETKKLLDENYKKKGYPTRASYIRELIKRDLQ